MFVRYFRASSSAGIVGTGIGLALVKQLVELHKGMITVHSDEGVGSTFTVKLPIDIEQYERRVAERRISV